MKRSDQLEWIDLGEQYYTREEYIDCLEELGKIGEKLGGDRATMKAVAQLEEPLKNVLEVGCGGGHFLKKFSLKSPKTDFLGIDLDPVAISCAKKYEGQKLSFSLQEKKELSFPNKTFDLVTATLVCHHMKEEELVVFLKQAVGISRKAIIINDLHRFRLARVCFWLACRFQFRNRLIRHDGMISIQRGFIKKEWQELLHQAGIPPSHYTIKWNWPFRWIVSIRRKNL